MDIEQQYITHYYLEFQPDDPEGLNKYKAILAPMFKFDVDHKEPFSCLSKTWMFTDIIFASYYVNSTTAVFVRDDDTIKAFGVYHITVFFTKTIQLCSNVIDIK